MNVPIQQLIANEHEKVRANFFLLKWMLKKSTVSNLQFMFLNNLIAVSIYA